MAHDEGVIVVMEVPIEDSLAGEGLDLTEGVFAGSPRSTGKLEGERIDQVRMEQLQKPDERPIPDHRFHDLVTVVSRQQAVAMVEEDPAVVMPDQRGRVEVAETHLFLEEGTQPVVVIAPQDSDVDSPVGDVLQRNQDIEIVAGNHRTEVEPEVEEISQQVEMRDVLERLQETNKELAFPYFLGGDDSVKMCVGEKID